MRAVKNNLAFLYRTRSVMRELLLESIRPSYEVVQIETENAPAEALIRLHTRTKYGAAIKTKPTPTNI